MQRTLKLHKLPDSTRTPGFRKLTEKDLPQARKLLSDVRILEYHYYKSTYTSNYTTILIIFTFQYMNSFDLSPMFSNEEFKHWFLPQEGIIDAYVVVNDNKITGIIVLFYHSNFGYFLFLLYRII